MFFQPTKQGTWIITPAEENRLLIVGHTTWRVVDFDETRARIRGTEVIFNSRGRVKSHSHLDVLLPKNQPIKLHTDSIVFVSAPEILPVLTSEPQEVKESLQFAESVEPDDDDKAGAGFVAFALSHAADAMFCAGVKLVFRSADGPGVFFTTVGGRALPQDNESWSLYDGATLDSGRVVGAFAVGDSTDPESTRLIHLSADDRTLSMLALPNEVHPLRLRKKCVFLAQTLCCVGAYRFAIVVLLPGERAEIWLGVFGPESGPAVSATLKLTGVRPVLLAVSPRLDEFAIVTDSNLLQTYHIAGGQLSLRASAELNLCPAERCVIVKLEWLETQGFARQVAVYYEDHATVHVFQFEFEFERPRLNLVDKIEIPCPRVLASVRSSSRVFYLAAHGRRQRSLSVLSHCLNREQEGESGEETDTDFE